MKTTEEWGMTAVRYANAALRRLHLPTVDDRKLHQRLTYARILKLVPTSLKRLQEAAAWTPDGGLGRTESVYVMWWTGADTMPLLVKVCFENLRRHIHDHRLHLITRDNVATLFPSLKDEVSGLIRLIDVGKICIQHFSDLLRTLILVNGGGCLGRCNRVRFAPLGRGADRPSLLFRTADQGFRPKWKVGDQRTVDVLLHCL